MNHTSKKWNIAFAQNYFNPLVNESTHITLKILSDELSKNNNIFIFVAKKHKSDKSILKYKQTITIKYVQLSPFLRFKKLFFPRLISYFNHIIASPYAFWRYNHKRKIKMDVVIGFSSSNILALRTWLFKLVNPSIKTIHVLKSEGNYKSFKFWDRLILNQLDHIIVLTEYRKKKIIRLGIPKHKISKIYSPINMKRFVPLNQLKLKKKKGIKKKVILYYGHFNQFKGVEYLIKSLDFLKTKNLELVLLPSNNNKRHIYDKEIQQSKFRNIKILKSKESVLEWINLADVVVLPYPSLISTESNPSCLLESMACKTPIVTTKLLILQEIVSDNKDVLMALPKNPKDLAKKIDLMLRDTKLRTKLINNSYKLSKKFDIQRIAKQYEDLFL